METLQKEKEREERLPHGMANIYVRNLTKHPPFYPGPDDAYDDNGNNLTEHSFYEAVTQAKIADNNRKSYVGIMRDIPKESWDKIFKKIK